MGAGAVGSSSPVVGEALNIIQQAGRNAQHRYLTLPGHVLVFVTAEDVRIWR
jgi:hypothetical protein